MKHHPGCPSSSFTQALTLLFVSCLAADVVAGTDQAVLTVYHTNDGTGVRQAQVFLKSSDLDIYSVELKLECGAPPQSISAGSLASGMMMAFNTNVPGVVIVALAGATPVSGFGELLDLGLPDGFAGLVTIQEASVNEGQALVSIVNGSVVTGQVELQSFLGTGTVPLHTRTVTFVATAAGSTTPLQTWVLALTNVTGAVFNFALTDVPPTTAAVSAKTDWNLRRKLAVPFDSNGLAVANFTGGSKLLGGDINATYDNKINAFDNTLLKNNWGAVMPGAAPADINGDGKINAFDNTILKNNWGSTGDAQ